MSADDPRDETESTHLHAHDEPDDVTPSGSDPDDNGSDRPASIDLPPSGLHILYNGDDEDDEGDEFDDEEYDPDDARRSVLITGASGNIGTKLRDAWADVYDLVLMDRENPQGDPDLIVADLAEWDDDWITHFHGVDTVVHLAGNPNEFAPWEELLYPNLDALANVFHAAVLAGVERIVFASSNHAMGEYRYIEGLPITVDLPPKPDGPYGGLKLVGERFGRSMAKAFDMSFVALRLGWIQAGENLPETLPHDWAKTHWLSNRDLVKLFECAVEIELGEREYVVANGVSKNAGTRWDLTSASDDLGFEPLDDAYEKELS